VEARARRGNLLGESLHTLVAQRRQDARPLGQVFGDAVRSSLQSLLFVGGCIIMFSVFIAVLQLSGVMDLMAIGLGLALQPLGVDPAVIPGLVNGAIEITLGTQSVAAAHASLVVRLAAAGAIVAWSGISVHAQVAAMLHGTDVRLRPYILARALHAALAAVVTFVLMGLFGADQPVVTASTVDAANAATALAGLPALWHSTLAATALFGGSGVLLAGMAAMRGVRVRLFRV
ncbi:MAG TPA: sporulation integral membrane protein YlbJ, partial [Limnochordia bacterium]|nr:sporulation integral membrane protein YlbJ [Limnochordia bacterium]